MIDLHSHILPAIDDGSADPEMTAALREMLHSQGVEAVVATPHFYAHRDQPEAFLQRRDEALAQLPKEGIPVLSGAEVAYFDGIGHCAPLQKMTLGNTKLLLVEMPYGDWTERMVREVCDLSLQQGLQPVLAHIDRYRAQFQKYAGQFAQNSVLFQCNADAFLSWRTRSWALKLLDKGWIHFLGSDCHNLTTRPPRMAEAAAVIEKKLGSDALADLTAFTKEQLGIEI